MNGIGDVADVKLPYLVKDTDRYGKVRWYVRRKGSRKIKLPGDPGSPEWNRAYEAAVASTAGPPDARATRQAGAEGTFRRLVIDYYGSAEFRRLAPRTQGIRRRVLDAMCERAGHRDVAEIDARAIRRRRDEDADRPEAANLIVKTLRQVFAYGLETGAADRNPARDVPYIRTGSEGFHTWNIDEVRRYEATHPPGTRAHLALALLLYTGQRRSDVVTIGRQHIRDGWLRLTQAKNRARKPVVVEIPVLPQLQAAIDAAPAGLTFLVTEFGKPFTAAGFGNRFRKWCDEAGLHHCSAHGLRKAGATIAAENGATEQQLMAIFGWSSPKQAGHYTKAARRKMMAGVGMALITLEREPNGECPTAIGDGVQQDEKPRRNSRLRK